MAINAGWHEKNLMPRAATMKERIRWHLAHARACGCRPIPARVDEAIRVGAGARAASRGRSTSVRPGRGQFHLRPIGVIRSSLKDPALAPRQGTEGAPDAWLEVEPWAQDALRGIAKGDELVVITWLHQGRRDVLEVHPRGDPRLPLAGVFATPSPDRPNPLGLHVVTVRRKTGNQLRIGPIEAIDGTPVVDVKPVI